MEKTICLHLIGACVCVCVCVLGVGRGERGEMGELISGINIPLREAPILEAIPHRGFKIVFLDVRKKNILFNL